MDNVLRKEGTRVKGGGSMIVLPMSALYKKGTKIKN